MVSWVSLSQRRLPMAMIRSGLYPQAWSTTTGFSMNWCLCRWSHQWCETPLSRATNQGMDCVIHHLLRCWRTYSKRDWDPECAWFNRWRAFVGKESSQSPYAEVLNSVSHVLVSLWPGHREQKKWALTSSGRSAKAAVCAVSKNLGSCVIAPQCWRKQRMAAYCLCLLCDLLW